MNLNTRLVQLDAAIHMELSHQVYKAVNNIHSLMSLSKKVFQPKIMGNYNQTLALLFSGKIETLCSTLQRCLSSSRLQGR